MARVVSLVHNPMDGHPLSQSWHQPRIRRRDASIRRLTWHKHRGLTRGLIFGAVLATALAAGTAAPLTRTFAQARLGQTFMSCVNVHTISSYVFRSAPRRCAVHFANKPFDGDDIALVAAIRWSGWGRSVARGHGTFHGNMNYAAPSTIVVSRRRRCPNGTRNYTRASITTRGIGRFSGPLAACRG